MSPFFSIIIPTYNVEVLLPSALDSILKQNFDDYEVVIMDGLSEDKTFAIAKDFARKNKRIKVYSKKDEGIYDAMNEGIKKASGSYLFFLGSDDTFYNHKVFNNVYKALKNHPVDVLYGDVYSTRFNGVYDGVFTAEKLYFRNICHQAIFFSKTIFDNTGLFNLKYKAHADYDHNLKWFLNKNISNRYQRMTIANYADGGFSSINEDLVFKKDKKRLFFKRAFGQVSLKFYLKECYPKLFCIITKIRKKLISN